MIESCALIAPGDSLIKIVTLVDLKNWDRPIQTRMFGWVDPLEVAAVLDSPSRQIDGEYRNLFRIILKSGTEIEAVGDIQEFVNEVEGVRTYSGGIGS